MPATAFQRLAARAIDAVVVLFILFLLVITHIFWYMDELSDAHQYSPWGRSFIASVSYLGLYIIYEAVFHTYNRGQTPGKLAMNIYLTALPAATFGQDNNINNINSMKSPVDTGNIHAPRLYQSLIRIILPVTPLLFFEPWPLWASLACLATGIPVLWSTKYRGRAIHDFLANTCVIYIEPAQEDADFFKKEKELHQERREKYNLGLFRQIWGKEGGK